MRSLLFALLLVHLTGLSGDCAAEPVRSDRPMFKGMELYSWLDPGTREWCFVLLRGTNRNKMSVEIRGSRVTVCSLRDLENAISKLAPSESVFWAVPETGGFSLPLVGVTDGIVEYAASLGVSVRLITR